MRKIVVDAPKRLANLAKHGLDLEDVVFFDWDTALIGAGHADRYGRPRMKAVGWFFGRVMVVIYAELGTEAISIVSFRPASAVERALLNGDET